MYLEKITKRTTKKQLMENDFWGSDIQYASKKIRDDYDVAMKACKVYCGAFRHLSDRLRDDKDILLSAINGSAKYAYQTLVEYASDRLKNDKEIIKKSVAINVLNLFYASEPIKNDIPCIIELMDINPSVIECACTELRGKVFTKLKDQIKDALKDIKEANDGL
jgi:hypothetical protein